MFAADVNLPECFTIKLFDKTNSMTVAEIERCLASIANIIKSADLIIGYDLKESIKNFKLMTGTVEPFVGRRLEDVKIRLQLECRTDVLEKFEHIINSEGNYVDSRLEMYKLFVNNFYSDKMKFPGNIYTVMKSCIIPYAKIETKGIAVKPFPVDDQRDEFYEFMNKVIEHTKDDILYPQFKLNGAITGRTSCTLHAMPNSIRDCFGARPGKSIICFDYNAGEARILAGLSKDATMLKMFDCGIDMHVVNAAALFDKNINDVTAEERQDAKNTFFAILYGASAKKYEKAIFLFKKLYKEAFEWIEKTSQEVIKNKIIENPFGRVREFRDIDNEWELKTKAINSLIQSTLSDMKLDAIAKIDAMYDNIIILEIHDAIYVEVDTDKTEEVINNILGIMEAQSKYINCKVKVNYKVGDTL